MGGVNSKQKIVYIIDPSGRDLPFGPLTRNFHSGSDIRGGSRHWSQIFKHYGLWDYRTVHVARYVIAMC